jgi:hypothetical protein
MAYQISPPEPQEGKNPNLYLYQIAWWIYQLANGGITIDPGDVEIGAVEIKDATTDTRAKIGTLSGLLASDVGVPVTDPILNALATGAGFKAATVGYNASATFTPAASSHAAGDVNGGAQEFTSMGPSAGRIMITSASLEIDGATAEASSWRLYLFNVTPPSALADDAAFTLPSGDRASFLGQIDLGTAVDLGDTQYIEGNGINKQVKLSGTSLFGYLVNLTTLTPANVAHKVTLHAVSV